MAANVIVAYIERTALAMAAETLFRSIMGFIFLLFAPVVHRRSGDG